MSTPVEALFLELGILSIGTIIKANYLHYLATRDESEMIYKVESSCQEQLVSYSETGFV